MLGLWNASTSPHLFPKQMHVNIFTTGGISFVRSFLFDISIWQIEQIAGDLWWWRPKTEPTENIGHSSGGQEHNSKSVLVDGCSILIKRVTDDRLPSSSS